MHTLRVLTTAALITALHITAVPATAAPTTLDPITAGNGLSAANTPRPISARRANVL